MSRPGFVFDQGRCTGCHACQLACTIENDLPLTTSWRQVVTFNPRRQPGLPMFHLSLACNHCGEAPCIGACPARAIHRDPATRAVLIDGGTCIGCRYCGWACPYDALRFDRHRGVMTKCTLCVERLRAGYTPACAVACPTGALEVTTLEERDVTVRSVGVPDGRALRPAMRVLPWDVSRGGMAGDAHVGFPRSDTSASTITLRTEWPLAIFTLAASTLVALVAAHIAGAVRLPTWSFLGVALFSMVLSAVHLGKKERAWRAVLGIHTSWLSREIASFTGFVVLGVLGLSLRSPPLALDAAVLGLGVATLVSIDRVYRVHGIAAASPGLGSHSAGALLTGLLLTGVFAGLVLLAVAGGAVKALFYLRRKAVLRTRRRPVRPVVSALRLGLGLVLPAVLWLGGEAGPNALAVVSLLVGECIDRAELYQELDVLTPSRQMELDLRATRPPRRPAERGAA
jgi:Fe-S-cluster-containing dehydrogenase component/DMSO reductase anchor subunit